MISLKHVLVAALAVLSLVSQSFGQESRIRQASQNTRVIGHVGQQLRFTVTVQTMQDIVEVRLRDGSIFARTTAAQFVQAGFVSQVVHHSGGEMSLRVRFQNPQAAFHRGTVATFTRYGHLRDRDRIILN